MPRKINFLEKGPFVLTYRRMAAAFFLWIAFCFFIFLVEGGYGWWLKKGAVQYEKKLAQLNERKERTLALVEASKVKDVQADVKGLSEVYAHFPVWSQTLSALSASLPPQLWLTSVATTYLSEVSMARKIEIGGMARNTGAITRLLKGLNEEPLFHNVTLNQSTRLEEEGQKKGYSFIILGEIDFGMKEWN